MWDECNCAVVWGLFCIVPCKANSTTKAQYYALPHRNTNIKWCGLSGFIFRSRFMKQLVAQSWSTLFNPVYCSPPGSSVYGIHQARILEGVAISLLQGLFLTQGSNPSLLHCRQIIYNHVTTWASLVVQIVKSAWNVEDLRSIFGSGRSPGEGKGFPLQSSCLENFLNRGAWQVDYSPWVQKESDTTEWLTYFF